MTTKNVLAVDIGGAHVKCLCEGQTEVRKFVSGPTLTARQMVAGVRKITKGWSYDRVSIGYPGPVLHDRPLHEPHNLGDGWVGFDFEKAFACRVKIVNDAVMQALGSYEGGRMLFLGLGTGLGSALIVKGVVVPMELGHLPYRAGRSYEDYTGQHGLDRLGRRKWQRRVLDVVGLFSDALNPEYVVLGGGNSRLLTDLPAGIRTVENANAFVGGFRLWESAGRRKRRAARRD